MKCRHCKASLSHNFIDLGNAPPSNAYITRENLSIHEKSLPLKVLVCSNCWLVQTEDTAVCQDLFSSDYAYFSSYSSTWLLHAQQYVAQMISRFGLNTNSFIIEVAANDGYLLQYAQKANVPCLGIEPTQSTALSAKEKGIDIVEGFFGVDLAEQLSKKGTNADLMTANNVLAHVPDINDFVSGFTILLKQNGVATFEFPHLMQLVAQNQFDTIYHEHYSYLSLIAVKKIFEHNDLRIFDVVELPTHGGSLRVFTCRKDSNHHQTTENVERILQQEIKAGMTSLNYYTNFQIKAETIKNDFLNFLINARNQGKKVIGYGAAAKGNTLLNFTRVHSDLINFVVDRNPAKQGKHLPGSHIPIVDESHIKIFRPDYVVILPWNLKEEIIEQLKYIRDWGGQFVTAIPQVNIES